MRKKSKTKSIIYEKPLGELNKRAWRRELYRTIIRNVIVAVIALIFIIPILAWARGDFDGWFRNEPTQEYAKVKAFESEVMQYFQIRTEGKEMDIRLLAVRDNGLEPLDLGEFHLEFRKLEVWDGGTPQGAFVLYYPPDDWYLKVTSEKTDYEEITKPTKKQRVGVDPTFYKDEDFPYEHYPVEEIEITTNKIINLLDENETIYDFYVRVREDNKDFDILSLEILTK
jgi:hypothetical protein